MVDNSDSKIKVEQDLNRARNMKDSDVLNIQDFNSSYYLELQQLEINKSVAASLIELTLALKKIAVTQDIVLEQNKILKDLNKSVKQLNDTLSKPEEESTPFNHPAKPNFISENNELKKDFAPRKRHKI